MKRVLLTFACIVVLAGAASAHHSAAMFDSGKLVILRGSVLSFTNLNPHAWISLTAQINGAGKSERWDVETTAPLQLAAMGISEGKLKPGDKVTVGIRPMRDGRRAGAMVFLITPDGVSHGAKLSDLGLELEKLKP